MDKRDGAGQLAPPPLQAPGPGGGGSFAPDNTQRRPGRQEGGTTMQYQCRITVLETKVFPELQEQYLADPKSGPCPCFQPGDTFLLQRTPEQDDFYHLMNGRFCGEAWDAISRYVYAALQGGAIMRKWSRDDRMMIACCNDGTRPVIFKIERIDLPETEEERRWLAAQHFENSPQDAYTG